MFKLISVKNIVRLFFKSSTTDTSETILSFFLGSLAGLLILLLFLTGAAFWVKASYKDKVYPGIFVFDQPVSGKSVDQLEEFFQAKEKEFNQRKMSFYWSHNGDKSWSLTPAQINFGFDRQATINDLMALGRKGNQLENLASTYRLLVFPLSVKPTFTFDQESLNSFLNQISAEVDRPVQDALFEFKEGRVSEFQVSKEGRQVDQNQLRSLISLAFSQAQWQKKELALDLPVKTIEPEVTTDKSNRLGIRELLGEGESFFLDSISSRVHNIILASSYLNGIVIGPGENFSFTQKIGDISAATGYQQAWIIRDSKTLLEDGGGVCQVSTTLFRAALNSGLPIVERQPHYYRVGYYEQGGYPPGLDATVYPPSPDLKFKNDTSNYILIQMVLDKDKKRLAFQIYGTSDNRRVELEEPIIHSQTPPPDPVYLDEPTLPAGVVKRLDTAHWGAKVSVTRTVWNQDGTQKEQKTWWSNYVPWAAVYQRGTGG